MCLTTTARRSRWIASRLKSKDASQIAVGFTTEGPAGFGKTTLVSEWITSCGRPVAWLSLDEGDNDPTRFLTYLIAALQTVSANIGEGVLAVLQAPQPPSIESILTALLNEIATIPDHFILVLDDYHVIDAKPVDYALTFDAALTFL